MKLLHFIGINGIKRISSIYWEYRDYEDSLNAMKWKWIYLMPLNGRNGEGPQKAKFGVHSFKNSS